MRRFLFLFLFIIIASCSENNEDIIEDDLLNENVTGEESVEEEQSQENPSEESQSEEENEIEVDLPQKWNLFKYICCSNVEAVGENMEIEIFYAFNKDKSFKKTQIKENDTIVLEGDFYTIESDNGKPAYKLQFDEFDHSIQNCSSREKEYLSISEEDDYVLINDTRACDGPAYFYEQ